MIRYNEFLVLLKEKNSKNLKIKDIIFGSIEWVRVQARVEFDLKIYEFFGFRSRKLCLEPKIFGRVQVRSIFDRSNGVRKWSRKFLLLRITTLGNFNPYLQVKRWSGASWCIKLRTMPMGLLSNSKFD